MKEQQKGLIADIAGSIFKPQEQQTPVILPVPSATSPEQEKAQTNITIALIAGIVIVAAVVVYAASK